MELNIGSDEMCIHTNALSLEDRSIGGELSKCAPQISSDSIIWELSQQLGVRPQSLPRAAFPVILKQTDSWELLSCGIQCRRQGSYKNVGQDTLLA